MNRYTIRSVVAMCGLTLLEVVLAGFILTTATLVLLLLLLAQRVTLYQMRDQMMTEHLLTTISEQLQAALDASGRERVLERWREISKNLLPYHAMHFQCAQRHCLLCIFPKKTTIHENSETSCVNVLFPASRY